ncbi:MAG TPA: hypothetical protein VGG61_00510, partial [Gemmataceae bacterium]
MSTKLFTCLKGHEWELALRRPSHSSDNWIVCPVCGGRPEDPPVELPDKVPPKQELEEPLPPPDAPRERPGVGRYLLMLILGGVLGAAAGGGIAYGLMSSAGSEIAKLKTRIAEAEDRLRGRDKEQQDAVYKAKSETEDQFKGAEQKRVQAEGRWRDADDERKRYQHEAARLAMDRGLRVGREGDYGAGMLWLARSLEATPAEDKETIQSLHRFLGGLYSPLYPKTAELPHGDEVLAVATSPDGKLWATGCKDKTARLWDAVTHKPVGEPLPHDGPVTALAFSSDSRKLATGSADGFARIWDV